MQIKGIEIKSSCLHKFTYPVKREMSPNIPKQFGGIETVASCSRLSNL